jgi:hypothetical protein
LATQDLCRKIFDLVSRRRQRNATIGAGPDGVPSDDPARWLVAPKSPSDEDVEGCADDDSDRGADSARRRTTRDGRDHSESDYSSDDDHPASSACRDKSRRQNPATNWICMGAMERIKQAGSPHLIDGGAHPWTAFEIPVLSDVRREFSDDRGDESPGGTWIVDRHEEERRDELRVQEDVICPTAKVEALKERTVKDDGLRTAPVEQYVLALFQSKSHRFGNRRIRITRLQSQPDQGGQIRPSANRAVCQELLCEPGSMGSKLADWILVAA